MSPMHLQNRPFVGLWSTIHLRIDIEGRWANHATEHPGEWSQNGHPERTEDIRYFLDRCAASGIDRIYASLHPYATGHPAYPKPKGLPNALGIAVDAAHERRIEVHPYLAVFLLPGSVRPDHPLKAHAEDFVERTRDERPASYGGGDHGEGRIYSYGYDEVRRLIIETYATLARTQNVDGVMLDYIRYPGPPQDATGTTLVGYAPPIVESFHRETGRDSFAIPNDDPAWIAHRAGYVARLIRELRDALPTRDGRLMEISACTGGDIDLDVRSCFRDWRTWVREGIVDTLCPMLYFPPEQVGRETRMIQDTLSKEAVPARAARYKLYSALCVKYGILSTPELLHEGYRQAMANGADGVCMYRADGLENTGLWEEVRLLGT